MPLSGVLLMNTNNLCFNGEISCRYPLRPSFFYFLFYPFFSQQVRGKGQNKNKNKIHTDHFPIELKSKETRFCVSFNFNSIRKWS